MNEALKKTLYYNRVVCYWVTVTRANFIMKRKKKDDDRTQLLDEEIESTTEANATIPTSASYINEGFKEEDQESSCSEIPAKIESTTSEKQKVKIYC